MAELRATVVPAVHEIGDEFLSRDVGCTLEIFSCFSATVRRWFPLACKPLPVRVSIDDTAFNRKRIHSKDEKPRVGVRVALGVRTEEV
jgi:hypothetical protein